MFPPQSFLALPPQKKKLKNGSTLYIIIMDLIERKFQLQSVSANFTRSSSELYSEIDKWAGNFLITFRSSEAISELRFEIRKFKLRVSSKMSEKKPDDELLNWMDSFRNHHRCRRVDRYLQNIERKSIWNVNANKVTNVERK